MALTYDPIGNVITTSGQSSVTFSSIPSTYTDLRLVGNQIQNNSSGGGTQQLWVRFNGDTGTNYEWISAGVSAGATITVGNASVSQNQIAIGDFGDTTTTLRGSFILDINGYATGSSVRRSTLFRSQWDSIYRFGVGNFLTTNNGITSITLLFASNNFTANNTFTLFGLKGN